MGPQRWRILLADDRSAVTRALGRRMRSAGHVVHTLPNPQSGVPLVVLSLSDVPQLEEEAVQVSHDLPAG